MPSEMASPAAKLQHSIWSTHDPACDQCRTKKQRCGRQRPICSNCERLDLPCDYSGRGKKPNQATEITRRLRGAEARIDYLETSLFRILPLVDRFEAEMIFPSDHTIEDMSTECTVASDLIQNDKFEWLPSNTELPQQRPFEAETSIASLATSLEQIALASHGENRESNEPLGALCLSLQHACAIQEWSHDGANNGVTVSKPPLTILQAMVAPYFDYVSDFLPILTKAKVEEQMLLYDEAENEAEDIASSLCFNNIILLTLTAKAQRRLAQEAPVAMELDLLKPFWENAMSAFADLDRLLRPRIINVQALLSLCLVCQSMGLLNMARRCLQLTQTLWRLMDLRATPLQRIEESPIDEDRINISWCINILEMSIPHRESDQVSYTNTEIPLPPPQPGNPAREYFLAISRLTQFRGRVQRDLFGIRTPGFPESTVQGLALGHLEELQRLQSSLGIDDCLTYAPRLATDAFQLSTIYAILSIRLMINKVFPGKVGSDAVLSDAKTAMRILIAMGNDTSGNLGIHALLPRLLSTDSHAALSLIASNAIRYPGGFDDIDMLKAFHQLLQKVNKLSAMATFLTVLETLVGAVLNFVASIGIRQDMQDMQDMSTGSDTIPVLSDGSCDFDFFGAALQV